MPFLRHPFRLLASLAAVASIAAPVHGQGAFPTFETATRAWTDSVRTWASLPDADRRERSKVFMRGIGLSEIEAFCAEGVNDPQIANNVAGFLKARFTLLPPTVDELAGMLKDFSLGMPCHRVVIQYLSRTKDQYTPAEGELLGAALLKLADHSTYVDPITHQFEMAAAHLSSSDSLLARMRRYMASDREDLRLVGVDMMAESKDPRAADLMIKTIEGYRQQGKTPPARVMSAAAARLGSKAYELLYGFYQRSSDADQKTAILQALAQCGDPRVMRVIIEAYGDEATGIRDATSSIEDRAAKEFYYRLWADSRLLEPIVLQSLQGNDPTLRLDALEVLDRASRYGLPVDPVAALQALRSFAAASSGDAALVQRSMETIARIERWREEARRRQG